MTSAVDLQQKGPEEDGKCQNEILLRLNISLKVNDKSKLCHCANHCTFLYNTTPMRQSDDNRSHYTSSEDSHVSTFKY